MDQIFPVASIIHRAARANAEITNANAADGEQTKQLDATESLLREGLAKYPDNIEWIAALMKLSTERGDAVGVANMLRLVPASSANDNRVWRYKGWLHRHRDEWGLAESAFRTALKLDSYDWRSRTFLAEVLRFSGRDQESKLEMAIADTGHRLETTLLESKGGDVFPIETLQQMQATAASVGDSMVADQLTHRIAEIRTAIESGS